MLVYSTCPEKAVHSGQKKAEDAHSGQKAEDVHSEQKKAEDVQSEQKAEDVHSGQKKAEDVNSGRKKKGWRYSLWAK